MNILSFMCRIFIFCIFISTVLCHHKHSTSDSEEQDSANQISTFSGDEDYSISWPNPIDIITKCVLCILWKNDVQFIHHYLPKMVVSFKSRKTFKFEPEDPNESPRGKNYKMYTGSVNSIKKLRPDIKYKFLFHGFSGKASDFFPLDVVGGYQLLKYIEDFYVKFPKDQLCVDRSQPNVWMKCENGETSPLARHTSDMNIVSIDWSAVGPDFSICNYIKSFRCLEKVSTRVAEFIIFLMEKKNLSLEDCHFIGFSFGAQIAAKTAEILKKKTGKLVGRISGLDPAFPGFTMWSLNKNHAKFVDVVHTSDFVGKVKTIGHVDVYSNSNLFDYGWSEDCRNLSLADRASCAHHKAHQLFAFSVLNPDYPIGYECEVTLTGVILKNNTTPIRIGEYIDHSTVGVYCFCRNMLPLSLGKVLNTTVEIQKQLFNQTTNPKWGDLFTEWNVDEQDEC